MQTILEFGDGQILGPVRPVDHLVRDQMNFLHWLLARGQPVEFRFSSHPSPSLADWQGIGLSVSCLWLWNAREWLWVIPIGGILPGMLAMIQ